MKLLDIGPDLAVSPFFVVAVKRGMEGQSVVYTTGQSALEGFVVDRDFDELVDELNEVLEEAEEQAEQEED